MNPGMSDQVAALRCQELIDQGLHDQFVASVLPTSAGAPAVRTVLKQHLGKVMVRVRVRLQEMHADSAQSLAPGALGTEGVSASSQEPIYWLSPCRLP
jgi:hypothetical protein